MKKIYTLTIALFCVITTMQGQNLKDNDVVKINTKFILKLETVDSIHYTFNIIKTEPFYQTVNLSESKSLFNESVEDGYIQGIFTYGKFGSQTNCFLMMKNGFLQSLDYELKIKVKGKRKPAKTSVVSLYSNVVSTELWSYDIDYVIFSNFKKAKEFEYSTFKPTIDSTCIKNQKNNQQFADSLFVSYIDTLNHYFLCPNGLNIEKAVDFEKSINSIDVTRDYRVLLGEEIYPNKNHYYLEKSIDFKRIECPYFNARIEYFYTKKDNLVRAILFEWKVFKESDDPFESMDNTLKNTVFREKFSKIEDVMTNLLGNPTFKELESEKMKTNYRDSVKWIMEEKLKAYLFMFAYGEIRLAIYVE